MGEQGINLMLKSHSPTAIDNKDLQVKIAGSGH